MKSFGLVENRILECDYLLNRLIEVEQKLNIFQMRCYLNSFITMSRGLTFVLKSSLNGLPKLEEWFQIQMELLSENEFSRSFVLARNEVEKVGIPHLNSGQFIDGKSVTYIDLPITNSGKNRIRVKTIDACCSYFKTLLEVIHNSYVDYGVYIDPEQYYSLKGLAFHNLTIEDVEEEHGIPRGYTEYGRNENNLLIKLTDEERLDMLWRHIPMNLEIAQFLKKTTGRMKNSTVNTDWLDA
ncbi:hypothetical protein M902_2353 [Bacteriovorax sp. BAL6_X]|uniref:hypothetical protein n=1 Tax=Bacteriovorax sp. BAL6_X TaxID=1201290 RepID=UPI000385508B|nr:hypothetical protein [Bacteriovorax sp. BAL6_X]EPZ51906.1 hypothetical protein M902_2353 [Bacteriovorax sp. BAL6_X]